MNKLYLILLIILGYLFICLPLNSPQTQGSQSFTIRVGEQVRWNPMNSEVPHYRVYDEKDILFLGINQDDEFIFHGIKAGEAHIEIYDDYYDIIHEAYITVVE